MAKRKFRRNVPNTNKYIIGLISIILIGIIGFLSIKKIHRQQIQKKAEFTHFITDCDHVKYANAPIKPSEKLNDQNEDQLVHALKNGIKPFNTNAQFDARIKEMIQKSILVEVVESPFYQVKTLKYSQPYLIPEAVDMLNEIGYRFQTRLKEKKYNNYKFRITSILRTIETQSNLSHHNGNASDHSAHLYGTTVDISYKNFINTQKDTIEASYEAVQTLTKVLIEMRKECKFMVVRERHQSCFHMTVVVCKPEGIKNEKQ